MCSFEDRSVSGVHLYSLFLLQVGVARQSLKELRDSAEEVIADLEDLENLDIEADNLVNEIYMCVHKCLVRIIYSGQRRLRLDKTS